MSTNGKREFWIDPTDELEDCENESPVYMALRKHPNQGPLHWQANLIHVIEYSAYEQSQKEIIELKAKLALIRTKIEEHQDAYALDIFPDDKREPCQTTAGRMGRHMCKCFLYYLELEEK